MRRALLTAALLLAGCRDGHRGAGSRPRPSPSPLEVTVLADHLERPAGIALDAAYVYFPTREHGVFRVARAGGKPEAQPASGWVAPPWSSVHRGIAMTVIKRAGSPDPRCLPCRDSASLAA